MRISDWSSDVCSSDLPEADGFWILFTLVGPVLLAIGNLYRTLRWPKGASADALAPGMLVAAAVMLLGVGFLPGFSLAVPMDQSLPLALIIVQSVVFAGMFLLLFRLQKIGGQIGRASCRARVCQYV